MSNSSFRSAAESAAKGLVSELVSIFLTVPDPKDEQSALSEIRPRVTNFSSSDEWRYKYELLGATTGFVTSVPGGALGITLIFADLIALRRFFLRGVIGIGLLENKQIDLKTDLPAITLIWSGKMSVLDVSEYATAKVTVKVAHKASIKSVSILIKAGSKLFTKIAAKASIKFGNKAFAKSLPLVVTPLVAKMASKISAKQLTSWIPGIAGVISAAVNVWIIRDFLKCAQIYYRNDEFKIDEDLVEAFYQDGIATSD